MSTQYVTASLFEIGTTVADLDIDDILFIALRLIGSGPGGDHVQFRTVPNTIAPVGQFYHHKHWEIIIAFDQNMYTPLFNTDVEEGAGTGTAMGGDVGAVDELAAGHPIGRFRISITDNAGTVVVWTWAVSTTFVANFPLTITNEEDHQPCEVKFISRGLRVVT